MFPQRKEGVAGYLRRILYVDPKVLEQRDIVRVKGSYDYIFLILVLVLLFFGTIMVYSASYAYAKHEYNDSYYIIFRQLIFIVIGFIGMGFAMWVRPEWIKGAAKPIYVVCAFLLVIVLIPGIGKVHGGARRWISLGFTEIQPSEFMKFGLVVAMAFYVDLYYERITDPLSHANRVWYGNVLPLGLIGFTCILLLFEKHLSGTIILFLIGMIIIFISGAPVKGLLTIGGIAGVIFLIVAFSVEYTRTRLNTWLHPELDPRGAGYQPLQGMYAIGSGGVFGVGLGESRQKHLYVSQPQNDYIFTIVAEELGLIGGLAVILLFVLFVWRGFVIAMKAPDTFSSLLCAGIVGKVAVQAVLNIGVVTNMLPPTGISLPFFSYGGSSLCVLMTEMGVVLSCSRYSRQKK